MFTLVLTFMDVGSPILPDRCRHLPGGRVSPGSKETDMKDDVEKYIARRKRTDGAFAGDFDSGYEAFKIGAMLRQAREDAGVTQETLARITKTKKSAIARLENHAQDVRLGDWFAYPKGIVSSSPGLAPCAYLGEMVGGFLN